MLFLWAFSKKYIYIFALLYASKQQEECGKNGGTETTRIGAPMATILSNPPCSHSLPALKLRLKEGKRLYTVLIMHYAGIGHPVQNFFANSIWERMDRGIIRAGRGKAES